MNLSQIRALAQARGIKAGRMKKVELVRAIQTHEGNFPCFGTAYEGVCDQTGCLWREDCFAVARKALAS